MSDPNHPVPGQPDNRQPYQQQYPSQPYAPNAYGAGNPQPPQPQYPQPAPGYGQPQYAQTPGAESNGPYAPAPAGASQAASPAYQDPNVPIPPQQFGPDGQQFAPQPTEPGAYGAPAPRKSKTGLILGIIGGIVALILVIILVAAFVIPKFLKPTAQDYSAARDQATKISEAYNSAEDELSKIIYATSSDDFSDKDAQTIKDNVKTMQDTVNAIKDMKAYRDDEVKEKVDAAQPAIDRYAAYMTNIADTAPAYNKALKACGTDDTYDYSDPKDMQSALEDCSAALKEMGKSKDESFAKFGNDGAAEYDKAVDIVKQLVSMGDMSSWDLNSPNWNKYLDLENQYEQIDFDSISTDFDNNVKAAQDKVKPQKAIDELTDTLNAKALG